LRETGHDRRKEPLTLDVSQKLAKASYRFMLLPDNRGIRLDVFNLLSSRHGAPPRA
jgi:hypothetical protein